MITRRDLTLGVLLTPAALAFARSAFGEEEKVEEALGLPDELNTSQLIYLTPIKSDGEESKCKAEIWFGFHNNEIYVVTPATAWRSEAIRKKLTSTRIWVGDFGNWQRANEKFREAPELMATGSIVEDEEVHAEVLEVMGKKYTREWGRWGPQFKSALEDGTRVMIKYTPEKSEKDVEA